MKKDGRCEACTRSIFDLDHADACFVLLADVALKGWPCLRARYDLFQTGQELAPIADAQSEGVLAFERVLERNRRGPSVVRIEQLTPQTRIH